MSFVNTVKEFFSKVFGVTEKGLVEVGKHSAELTAVATTVEALTGNAELIPLTQQAGAAAASVGKAIESGEGVVSAVSDAMTEVATEQGADDVAKVTKKVKVVSNTVSQVTGKKV